MGVLQSLACLKCNLLITPSHGWSWRGWGDNKRLFSQSWWERQSGDWPLDLLSLSSGSRPECFYFAIPLFLSDPTHTHSFTTSVFIPFLVSTWAQFNKKSNSYRQIHFLFRDTKLRQISPALLWKWDCRRTWPLGWEVKEHKPLCPKFPI